MGISRVIYACNAPCHCRNPEPAGVVKIKAPYLPWWHSVSSCEGREPVGGVAQEPAATEPDPQIARTVFAKCRGGLFRYAVIRTVAVKRPGRPLPSVQHSFGIVQCADPDISTTIFKDSEYLVSA